MADRPIIFSGPMVRALLDGRKSMTRRVLCHADPNPEGYQDSEPPYVACGAAVWCDPESAAVYRFPGAKGAAVGDRLWVREAWAGWMASPNLPAGIGGIVSPYSVVYRADETEEQWARLLADRRAIHHVNGDRQDRSGNWVVRSPIHMPRWASRLTLTVTDVRVQRVQEISEMDARAEGCRPSMLWPHNAKRSFEDLWDLLNTKRGFGWDANPWCAAISFRVHRSNIDSLPGDA